MRIIDNTIYGKGERKLLPKIEEISGGLQISDTFQENRKVQFKMEIAIIMYYISGQLLPTRITLLIYQTSYETEK